LKKEDKNFSLFEAACFRSNVVVFEFKDDIRYLSHYSCNNKKQNIFLFTISGLICQLDYHSLGLVKRDTKRSHAKSCERN